MKAVVLAFALLCMATPGRADEPDGYEGPNWGMLYRTDTHVHLLTQYMSGHLIWPEPDWSKFPNFTGEGEPPFKNSGHATLEINETLTGQLTLYVAASDAWYHFKEFKDGTVEFRVSYYGIVVQEFPLFHYPSLDAALKIPRVNIMFQEVLMQMGQHFPIYHVKQIHRYFYPSAATSEEQVKIMKLIPLLNDPTWEVRDKATRDLMKLHVPVPTNLSMSPEQRLRVGRVNQALADVHIEGTNELVLLASELF